MEYGVWSYIHGIDKVASDCQRKSPCDIHTVQYIQTACSSCFGRSAVLGISNRSFVSTDSWPAYEVIILHTRSSTITLQASYDITCPLHALHARREIGSPSQGSTRQTSPSMALEARIPPRQGPGPGQGPPKSLRVCFPSAKYSTIHYSATLPACLLVHPWFTMATKKLHFSILFSPLPIKQQLSYPSR